MKKLLTILLLLPFVFAACGDDKEDELEYLDPAIIEGTWLREDGSYLHYSVFENSTCRDFVLDKYTGSIVNEWFYSKYQITKNRIYRTRNANDKTSYIEYYFKNDSVLHMKDVDYKRVPPLE